MTTSPPQVAPEPQQPAGVEPRPGRAPASSRGDGGAHDACRGPRRGRRTCAAPGDGPAAARRRTPTGPAPIAAAGRPRPASGSSRRRRRRRDGESAPRSEVPAGGDAASSATVSTLHQPHAAQAGTRRRRCPRSAPPAAKPGCRRGRSRRAAASATTAPAKPTAAAGSDRPHAALPLARHPRPPSRPPPVVSRLAAPHRRVRDTGDSSDVARQSSLAKSSSWVPGRGAQGSSLAGRTTISRSPRASWVTTGSK